MPRLTLKLLLVAIITLAACAFYTIRLNPEARFFTELSAIQTAWAKKMETEHGSKVVVFGGSSCIFSIVGEQMLREFRIPTVNRGMMVGVSLKLPAMHALDVVKRGDTLIAAIEPGQLTEPIVTPAIALQLSLALGHPQWVMADALGLKGFSPLSAVLAMKPGSYHVVTLLGKIVQRRPLFRYASSDASPSGWMTTKVRIPLTGPPGRGPGLSDDAVRFLSALRDTCDGSGVRIAYSLPWGYCPPEHLETFRRENAAFLREVAKYLPVLKDEELGAQTNPELFADTAWHLNEVGSELRTRRFGQSIRDWELWKPEELDALTKAPPSPR